MQKPSYVYILASGFKHLYIGVTTDLELRILQHKSDSNPDSFTARYNIKYLVYVEEFSTVNEAIAREKQLKRWSRIKKISLIVKENPTWRGLSDDWGKPTEPSMNTTCGRLPSSPAKTKSTNPNPARSITPPTPPPKKMSSRPDA